MRSETSRNGASAPTITAAQQPVLKTVRALAEVVRKSHEPALRFRAEIGGKHAAQRRRPFKMLRNRLAAQAIV